MNPCRLLFVGALVGLAIPPLLAQQSESPVDWVRSTSRNPPGREFSATSQ